MTCLFKNHEGDTFFIRNWEVILKQFPLVLRKIIHHFRNKIKKKTGGELNARVSKGWSCFLWIYTVFVGGNWYSLLQDSERTFQNKVALHLKKAKMPFFVLWFLSPQKKVTCVVCLCGLLFDWEVLLCGFCTPIPSVTSIGIFFLKKKNEVRLNITILIH